MKNWKRMTAMLMSLAMIGTLTACGNGNESGGADDAGEGTTAETADKKVKIQIMEWDSGVDNAETEFDVFMNTFPEYKDQVEFEVVTGGSGPIDIMETMRKLVASGEQEEMPDIIY